MSATTTQSEFSRPSGTILATLFCMPGFLLSFLILFPSLSTNALMDDGFCPSVVDSVGSECHSLAPYSQSGRTTFWAQEVAGIDLVRDEIQKLQGLELIDLAVMDLGFESAHVPLTEPVLVPEQLNGRRTMTANHGTAMVNIIHGPAPYGVTDQIRLMGLHAVTAPFYYSYLLRTYEESGRIPKVVSNSLGWQDAVVADTVASAFAKGVFWFLASGNSFPEPVRTYEVQSRAFLVGSYSPYGWTSFETQNHPDLLILAPADSSLATIDGRGQHSHIGQSSGANAMMAGTAANILSLLPSLSHQQFRTLVHATGFDSIENKLGYENMPRLLNAYKAFAVAKRIRRQCSAESAECIDEQLQNPSTFQFSSSPVSCSSVAAASVLAKRSLFLQLRKNALLGVSGQAEQLSCVYQTLGFAENAAFFEFVSDPQVDVAAMERETQEHLLRGEKDFPLYRFMRLYSPEIENFIRGLSHFTDYEKQKLLHLRAISIQ